MPNLDNQLQLSRCPHCNVSTPLLHSVTTLETIDQSQKINRKWRIYQCASCGGLVTASAKALGQEVIQIFPNTQSLDVNIPDRSRTYLQQAIESLHSPAGSVMLAASSVDSMLKLRGYKNGHLYVRIEQAVQDHLITPEMAKWAHNVRLDANDQRHADEDAPLPTTEDAKRCIDFTLALAQFMFVLPAQVQRGINEADDK